MQQQHPHPSPPGGQGGPPGPHPAWTPAGAASAVHWAATKGDLRLLRRLVEYEGLDPSARDASSHHCETPLFRAAGANHTEIIEYLLDYAHVDVNQTDDSNHTALSWTCYFPNNAETVALLLDKGADPTIATHDGRTPLMIASYAGYSDIAWLLLRFDPGKAAQLLEARIGKGNEYHKGCTPLLLAAQGKRWETVGVLLDEGADPTAEDGEGRSVLQLAKEGGAPKRLVHRIEHLIGDEARTALLHKGRSLSEASQKLTKAVLQTYTMAPPPASGRDPRSSPLSSMHERHARCIAAAPAYLKGRVANGDSLPSAVVVEGVERPWEGVLLEERAKAVAAHVIRAPPLAQGQAGGLPRRAYRMLMAMMVPRFVVRREEGKAREQQAAKAAAAAATGGSPGAEAAATVGAEDDEGVEESKGKGSYRERRESADRKQAQQQQQQQAQAQAPRAGAGAAKGMGAGVVVGDGAVEVLDEAMAKAMLNGVGGSGSKGRLIQQLQAQGRSRRSIIL